MVILDGLQVTGDLDALGEGVLGSLENLVMDAILQTSQEELMFDKLEGISDAFSLGLLDGGSSGSDSGHGGRLVVREALVSNLDMVRVVIDGFISFWLR